MAQVNNKSSLLVVAFVGAAVVAALLQFNKNAISYNQYIVGNLIGLFWVPMLTIFLVMRQKPDDYGFTLSSSKKIWIVCGVLYASLVVLMLAACRMSSFQNYYPLFRHYPEFWNAFKDYPAINPYITYPMMMLYAEASYGMYMFCWEYFFRGYLLFGLQKSIGWWAVLLQAIAFGILHAGKPPVEMIASFGAGIILGIIALKAKSFLPCFVLHWAASITFNLLIVAGRLR